MYYKCFSGFILPEKSNDSDLTYYDKSSSVFVKIIEKGDSSHAEWKSYSISGFNQT
jgi:hypothetical protein